MWTAAFWKGAAERAIKTAAQAFLGGFIVTVPITQEPWLLALGVAGTAAVASFVTSIANPSFVAGPPASGD